MSSNHLYNRIEVPSQVIVTTSWDDGHPMDLKLADLLSKFNIKGTFYITPHNRERPVMKALDMRILCEDFEIGSHSLTHPDLRSLGATELEKEVYSSKNELENLLGKQVLVFSYPNGKHNRLVRQIVMNSGYIGARTTKEFNLKLGNNAWVMPTTIHAFPIPYYIRLRHELITRNWQGIYKLLHIGLRKNWMKLAITLFEDVLKTGGIWHLWGHSWEIEKYGLWDDLSLILNTVSENSCVQYFTNSQVVKFINKF